MNFSFLQTLHLKTVVYLSLDSPSQIFNEFLKEQGISFIQLSGGEATNVGQRVSEQLVLDALKILLNPDCYPLAVMCNLGRHRTGTVIGCLRRIQKWSISSIFEEFRRFTGNKSSTLHEQFIELFDTELVEMPVDAKRLPFKISCAVNVENEEKEEVAQHTIRGRTTSLIINK